jgi:hypothetical protein
MILVVFMIIIILLLIRRSSNYISTDAVADYHYTFINPGYDIAGGGYTLVQAPGDVDKPADDLNTKIWSNPGSIGAYTTSQIYGVRKLLQIGGHGMVEYIIANTPPNQATTTNAIDVVTYNSVTYVIPDHIILKKSKISPVLFTCPPGQGTVTGDTCAVCSGSQWSDGTAACAAWTGPTSCPAGQGFTAGTASNDRSCAACTGIQYSLGGTNACANWTGPTSCPAGQGFTAGTASNDRSCAACTGQYSLGGTNACANWTTRSCTTNQYYTAGNTTADSACSSCPTGYISAGGTATTCPGFSPITYNYTGAVVQWTVPTTRSYTLTVAGAAGAASYPGCGTGGQGYVYIGATISLTAGTVVNMIVGGQGGRGNSCGQGGGGGTFVFFNGISTTAGYNFIIAGGGGGGAGSGTTGTNGWAIGTSTADGTSVTNGGNGGRGVSYMMSNSWAGQNAGIYVGGGYGGGGGGYNNWTGGGGGGYTGGNGGGISGSGVAGSGGSSRTNGVTLGTAGTNGSNGYVTIS